METNNYCSPGMRWHNRFWCYLGFGILGVIGFALFALIFGWVIMVLWNALLPSLFGFITISFWQAVGLALLARLLFGCSHMKHHHWRRRHWHRRHDCCNDHGHKGNEYRYKYSDCGCDSGRWQYYEQYWEEVGEKSFKEYVDKKAEEVKKDKE